METLILHVPKLFDKRELMLEGFTSTDHIYTEDEHGEGFIAAETFMAPNAEALVANYQTNELMMFKERDSELVAQMLKKKILFEPVETHFMMKPDNKRKHQSKRR